MTDRPQGGGVSAAPAVFAVDVNDPRTRHAEALLLAYFQGRCWPCEDRRGWRGTHDFFVTFPDGRRRTVDVKADHYIASTRRVPFEHRHLEGNVVTPAWGWHQDLDVVAVVGVEGKRRDWYCEFIDLPALRAIVRAANPGRMTEQQWAAWSASNDWARWKQHNEGERGEYVTEGWCIPLTLVKAQGAVLWSERLPDGGP